MLLAVVCTHPRLTRSMVGLASGVGAASGVGGSNSGVGNASGIGAAAAVSLDVAGERSWTQVGSWTHSGNLAAVDFTGLGGYSEFLVFHRGTTNDSSGERVLQVSVNNGSSWETDVTDYDLISDAGVETQSSLITILHTTGSGSARDCCLHIVCANLTAPPKFMEGRSKVASQVAATFTGTSAINAIRNGLSGASNYTGGTIKVYGR